MSGDPPGTSALAMGCKPGILHSPGNLTLISVSLGDWHKIRVYELVRITHCPGQPWKGAIEENALICQDAKKEDTPPPLNLGNYSCTVNANIQHFDM